MASGSNYFAAASPTTNLDFELGLSELSEFVKPSCRDLVEKRLDISPVLSVTLAKHAVLLLTPVHLSSCEHLPSSNTSIYNHISIAFIQTLQTVAVLHPQQASAKAGLHHSHRNITALTTSFSSLSRR